MNNYKRVSSKTVFGFGPHYKACMTQLKISWVNADRIYDKTGKSAEEANIRGIHWVVKTYGKLGLRDQILCEDAKDAFHELRRQLYEHEEDFKVWGEMLP